MNIFEKLMGGNSDLDKWALFFSLDMDQLDLMENFLSPKGILVEHFLEKKEI